MSKLDRVLESMTSRELAQAVGVDHSQVLISYHTILDRDMDMDQLKFYVATESSDDKGNFLKDMPRMLKFKLIDSMLLVKAIKSI
jgi:phage regulator Rha-like protein